VWLGAEAMSGVESNVFLAPSNEESELTLLTGLSAGVGFHDAFPLRLTSRYAGNFYTDHSSLDYHQFSFDGFLPVAVGDRTLEVEAGYDEDRDADGQIYEAAGAGAWLSGHAAWFNRVYGGARVEKRNYPGAANADSLFVLSEIGMSQRVTTHMRVGGAFGLGLNDADGNEFSYTEPVISAWLRQAFTGRTRMRVSGAVRFRRYGDDDPVFDQKRHDLRGKFLGEVEHDLSTWLAVRATLLYLDVSSNVDERSYHDLIGMAGVSVRWDNEAGETP
jgi:hypothetical protein